MKSFFATYKVVIIIVCVVLAGGGAYWYVEANQAPSFSAITPTQGNVIASLDEPGTVLAENSADLSFQGSGQITQVNVSEGDAVSAGEVLVSLNTSALTAGVDQANAGLAAAQAELAELQSGTRPQQLAIDESAVATASTSLGVSIGSAYGSADDAITNQTDNLFMSPSTNNPTFLVPTPNSQTENNIQSERVIIGVTLAAWYNALNGVSTTSVPLSSIANAALAQIQSYINTLALVVNSATPNSTMTAAVLAGYKTNVATARTEVTASISALTAAESALTQAQNTLTLAQAGATPQDIEAQQAAVLQAQAGAASAQVALQNAELIAPFSGSVENLTAQVGQVVAPGAPVLSLINNSGLKVQTYVSETDVAKIAVGDTADVTLDAYGTGTVFPATITTIDSDETQVNGSPAYQVTLHFTNPSGTIKDGMTGNVHIITGEHDNVLEVPTRLVINDGNNYFVLIKNGASTVQQPVSVGLTGDNGMTEITSGLTTSDTLVNF